MLNNIEAERGRMRLTKDAVAKELNISPRTYTGYINGTPIPHPVLIRMSRLFNCSVDYLLGLTTDRRA